MAAQGQGLKSYSKATVWVNGLLMAEEASVKMNFNSGLSKVYTVQKGFAGVSKGAPEVAISMTAAIPTDGFEYLPEKLPNGTVINCSVFTGSKTYSGDCIVMSYSIDHSANSHATISMEIAGVYQDWA